MSPEQILGDKLDFRSDLFSLGIVLYQCVTGVKPFVEDDSRTVMQKIRLDRHISARKMMPGVPHSLERILARCMEKLPANRYSSTQALIDDLMEFLAGRVGMNHSARLVMYLRDVGVIGEAEAEEVLKVSATRSQRNGGGDKSLVRSAALVFSALSGLAIMSGGAIQASAHRFGEESAFAEDNGRSIVPPSAGYIEVIADPWADVYIDGELVATTPTAERIALSAGKHYVKYKNPYFETHTTEVVVQPGQVHRLEAVLKPNADTQRPEETAQR
jgi:serine/threonine-protein kinase